MGGSRGQVGERKERMRRMEGNLWLGCRINEKNGKKRAVGLYNGEP